MIYLNILHSRTKINFINSGLDKSRCDVTLNGKCHISVNAPSPWQAAEDTCVEWGGHLTSIHSDTENYAVNSIRDTLDFTWIGLSDTAVLWMGSMCEQTELHSTTICWTP